MITKRKDLQETTFTILVIIMNFYTNQVDVIHESIDCAGTNL